MVASYGMILWEVLAGDGRVPFQDESKGVHPEDMRSNIARQNLRPALPEALEGHPGLGTP